MKLLDKIRSFYRGKSTVREVSYSPSSVFDSNKLYIIENGIEKRVSKFDIPGLSFVINGKIILFE